MLQRDILRTATSSQLTDHILSHLAQCRKALGVTQVEENRFDLASTEGQTLAIHESLGFRLYPVHTDKRMFSYTRRSFNHRYRRTAQVKRDYGLATPKAQPGDLICVLLGCSYPVVLRREKHMFRVVGAAFVDGYMKGAAVKGIKEGREQGEIFTIF